MTRTQLEAARTLEISRHNQKMQAYDALLQLVDPQTNTVSPEIIDMLRSTASAPEPEPSVPLRPLNGLESAILAIFVSHVGEWTSKSVHDYLVENNYALSHNRDAAMNAISGALAELVFRGEIVRVYQGRGRDPHRYERRKN